ncbi:MAG: CopG family transcriptional regulator [Pseudomonadota bacterium]
MPRQIKPVETEKITMNLGYVDLGRIDLLVEEGFYTNRTDFLRTAVRAQLDRHGPEVGALVERRVLDMGLRDITRAELEAAQQAGEMLHVKVVGLARLAADISPDLARQTIAAIHVLGALQAPPDVKEILADRIR